MQDAAGGLWLGMHWADWAVLALYFVVILVIGVWSYARVKNMSDFFMGGRRFGKVFMMFFAFGAGTSSEQAISVVAGTWRVGLAGIWWQFLWLWATPFYWIIAPVMRRMRALTTADFFQARFNTSTATLYTIYGIIMSIVFIAAGLYSSAKMVNALTGGELETIAASIDWEVPAIKWDEGERSFVTFSRQVEGYEYAILAMTILFVIYGMAGGLGAAIITDFIQGILTIVFSILLLPFVFGKIGGFGSLHDFGEVKAGMFDLIASRNVAEELGVEPITWFYVLMLSITALAGIVVQPHIMGVCGAGKTEFEGRFGFTVGNFLKRFCTVAWTFTGLACIVWYLTPQLSPLSAEELAVLTPGNPAYDATANAAFADELFGRAAYEILPQISVGLIGLLMASLLAAVMSTSDAQMVVSSGLFTENIYRRFMVRNASERHYLWVGRIAGLIIVLCALALQASFTDVIDALKVIIKTPAAIGISLWFGITWRKWNSWAVWISTLTAAAVWAVVAYFPKDLYGIGFPETMFTMNDDGTVKKMTDAWQMASYVGAGVAMGILVSLLTPRQKEEKLDSFFALIHTPVKPNEEVERPCTLPKNPLPQMRKLFPGTDIETPMPTLVGMGGFVAAWILVAGIIGMTYWLAANL